MNEPLCRPELLTALSRWPDVDDPSLQAWDATDELILQRASESLEEHPVAGGSIAVLGDDYGALTLSLLAAGYAGVRVAQDRRVHERCLEANAVAAHVDPAAVLRVDPDDPAGFDGAELVLWQLPRSVEEVRRGVALLSQVSPGALLVAGGRVKHLSIGMNAPLQEGFGPIEPQLARRKSRLLLARRDPARSLPAAHPREATHDVGGRSLHLVASPGTFGGARLDPGSRLLIETLHGTHTAPPEGGFVVDLGCGNGTLCTWTALAWPQAGRILAVDDSASAVRSTRLTVQRNGVGARVEVLRADADEGLESGQADVVLLNPPFHQGSTVHSGIATKLIEASARLLRPGGILYCVWNSHLRYRGRLENIVGPTAQLARDRTFTVTASTRQP